MDEWPATVTLYDALAAVGLEARNLSHRDRALLLRGPVSAAVDELRASGRPCDRIVRIIRLLATAPGLDEAHAPEVMDEIEAWCVQRYYAS